MWPGTLWRAAHANDLPWLSPLGLPRSCCRSKSQAKALINHTNTHHKLKTTLQHSSYIQLSIFTLFFILMGELMRACWARIILSGTTVMLYKSNFEWDSNTLGWNYPRGTCHLALKHMKSLKRKMFFVNFKSDPKLKCLRLWIKEPSRYCLMKNRVKITRYCLFNNVSVSLSFFFLLKNSFKPNYTPNYAAFLSFLDKISASCTV
jgi:hypothetical protein